MKKENSIRASILLTVTLGLTLLAILLVFVQSRNNYSGMIENTNALVKEQISLTVNQLDTYRVIDQVPFIATTVYQLERVRGLNIFDGNCTLLAKRPMNFKPKWNCDEKNLPDGLLLFRAENSVSMSGGAPRFILVNVRHNENALLSWNNLSTGGITIFLVLLTIITLNIVMRSKILNPIEKLNKIIGSSGSLKRNSEDLVSLPEELKPIYEEVFERDEIIQQSKNNLLQRKEDEVIANISEQVAHDIRFPIMVLRDKLLQDAGGANDIYESAFNDLEQLTGQLLENTTDYKKEIDVNGVVQEVIEKKRIEYKGYKKEVKMELVSFVEAAKLNLNPIRFKFTLSNLINNAIESVPAKRSAKIDIIIDSKDSNIQITVKDNGKGINSINLERVFERGVSIGKPGGNGLGLSDAKKFVENSEGSIDIKSVLTQGTEIILNFPAISSGYQSTGKAPYDHVLVEDYKLSQLLWLDQAREKGLSLAVFSSPQEFLRNQNIIGKEVQIYLDSHFPDFSQKGEEWAKDLYDSGYENLWMCSTNSIDTENMSWLRGSISKNRPFSQMV